MSPAPPVAPADADGGSAAGGSGGKAARAPKVDEASAAFKKELASAVAGELGRKWKALPAAEKEAYEERERRERDAVLKEAQAAAKRMANSGEGGWVSRGASRLRTLLHARLQRLLLLLLFLVRVAFLHSSLA